MLDRRLKFEYTARPHEFIEMLVYNLNKRDPGWTVGESVRFFFDNEEPHFSFTGELDSIWAQKDWANIGDRIRKGGFIRFSDTQFQPDGADIRIVTVTRPVNSPRKPKIELSNVTVSGSIVGELNKITENEVIAENQYRDALQFTKRRYRDSIETINLLDRAMLESFTTSIAPATVRAMMMFLGSQFRFVKSATDPTPTTWDVSINQSTQRLTAPAGVIQRVVAEGNSAGEAKTWRLPAKTFAKMPDASKGYYLQAKVSTSGTTGEFIMSDTYTGIDAVAGYEHLLVGILNSEHNGERSFAPMVGFTELLPGMVRTDRIVSQDGKTFFDLLNGIIGGNIHFTATDGSRSVAEFAEEITTATEDAQATAQEAKDYIDNTLPDMLSGLQDQIDGHIESFFHDYDPTMSNLPASEWTTAEEKQKHLNDTFTNTSTGGSWRFLKNGGIYKWVEIADTATSQALALAGEAKDTADGKRRVFVTTPTTPYDVGDLWTQGTNGDIMRCKKARASGNYTASDWEKASKYTDDSVAKAAQADAAAAKAITDNFTKIAGGLILTTLIKMMTGSTETGGLSANLDNILLWGGGTYAQALQNLAKTILRHDGSAQFAGGNLSWDTQGNIILKSNSSGVSVVIDPTGRRLYMTNSSGVIVGEWSFKSEYGSTIEITDGRTPASNISVSGRGFNSANQYGRVFHGDNQIWLTDIIGSKEIFLKCTSNASTIEITLKGLPTNAQGLESGRLWRDSSGYVRIA